MGTVVERFDEEARRKFDAIGRNEVYPGELGPSSRVHAISPLGGCAVLLSRVVLGLRNLSPLAVPLVHSYFRWRCAKPRTASVVWSGLRVLLRSADAELARAHAVDARRFAMDSQYPGRGFRCRETGTTGHWFLQCRTEGSVLGDRDRLRRVSGHGDLSCGLAPTRSDD